VLSQPRQVGFTGHGYVVQPPRLQDRFGEAAGGAIGLPGRDLAGLGYPSPEESSSSATFM
jgi:hypothetical protein